MKFTSFSKAFLLLSLCFAGYENIVEAVGEYHAYVQTGIGLIEAHPENYGEIKDTRNLCDAPAWDKFVIGFFHNIKNETGLGHCFSILNDLFELERSEEETVINIGNGKTLQHYVRLWITTLLVVMQHVTLDTKEWKKYKKFIQVTQPAWLQPCASYVGNFMILSLYNRSGQKDLYETVWKQLWKDEDFSKISSSADEGYYQAQVEHYAADLNIFITENVSKNYPDLALLLQEKIKRFIPSARIEPLSGVNALMENPALSALPNLNQTDSSQPLEKDTPDWYLPQNDLDAAAVDDKTQNASTQPLSLMSIASKLGLVVGGGAACYEAQKHIPENSSAWEKVKRFSDDHPWVLPVAGSVVVGAALVAGVAFQNAYSPAKE